ncbi:reactive intermediate/imine deaminase [Brumimicrobium salinarum]|uniref:Reactive intermediate/imine deaminase n=1 Tax=Brumimicrobium salinarum TaxID=2058658 RepID=A0A2I0R1D8_9FLAO|nr:RidA family protein [Brumimicrobium salinarum]PKR80387.1 reactive intermediate/imine deaminase [Brumimicrobium salinarum]
MKKVITIPNAPQPIGPYSQAVLKNDTLYVSGQIPIDPKTGVLQNHNIKVATQQVMENIKALVETAGLEMSDIIKCSIFLKSMNDFTEVNEVYAQYFNAAPPARETVEVKKLPMDVSVEISCIAIK